MSEGKIGMKLQRVIIDGFKNLNNVNVLFDDITALISINNFGKSNFLKGISFGISFIKANENVKNKDYIKEKELDGYHIYVGITKNEKIAEKIKVYYESLGNNVYVKQRKIDKKDFLNILEEYDKIIEITTSDKDLISIEHIVLSNYEEMVLQSESYD